MATYLGVTRKLVKLLSWQSGYHFLRYEHLRAQISTGQNFIWCRVNVPLVLFILGFCILYNNYEKAGWHANCARYQISIKFSSYLLLLNFRSSTQYRKNIQIPHASPGWWRRRRTRAPSSDSNKIITRRITKNHGMNITILYSQCNIVK